MVDNLWPLALPNQAKVTNGYLSVHQIFLRLVAAHVANYLQSMVPNVTGRARVMYALLSLISDYLINPREKDDIHNTRLTLFSRNV